MTKKILMLLALTVSSFSFVFAGGILTNTNQSARFGRLFALEGMTDAADAAYYNPAGTIKLPEGFHFTFTNQSAFQERHIISTSPFVNGGQPKLYKGTASAPIIPSIQGVYKKGKWALSGGFAIVGGGGKATFEQGLAMFEVPMSRIPTMLNGTIAQLDAAGKLPFPSGAGISLQGHSLNQYMTGTNYIFGGQIGGAYEINKMFSVYAGFRLNVVNNKYEGHLTDLKLGVTSTGLGDFGIPDMQNQMISPAPLFELATKLAASDPELSKQLKALALPAKAAGEGAYLESKQSGWGVAPILGLNFSWERLNIGMKYEFKTNLNVENKTSIDDTGSFADGVNTAHDVPALFAIGASYDIIDPITISFAYHHFFDKDAGMANDANGIAKQKHLTGGTNEYLFGAEWRINKMFLVSGGGQITRYGLSDKFQSDLSFYVNSYSLGFGGAVNVAKNVQINAAYFYTDYSDYKLASENKTYTRKNKVFTVGVDFSF